MMHTHTLLLFMWAIVLFFVNYYLGFVDGHIEALFAFGDSYVDTGNFDKGEGTLVWAKPYGSTWPGYGDGRFGNGHVQTDYIAKLLGLQSPMPFKQLVGNHSVGGINFAFGSSGVTYATGKPTLNVQVDEFEALVNAHMLSHKDLKDSVALVDTAVNDYTSYTGQIQQTIPALVDIVVDALAWNVVHLHKLGIQNFIVANVAPVACWPVYTMEVNYSHCLDNVSLTYQTSLHNKKLEKAVDTLYKEINGIQIILLDQTKVFEHLVHHGADLGFVQTLIPCCKGKFDNDVLKCGMVDAVGAPLYKVCDKPNKTLFWDGWHPTEAGWKAAILLYATRPEFTKFGNNLKEWLEKIE